MSDALIIRLRPDATAAQYLLVDASGGRLSAVLSGPLAQAVPLAVNRRVIVLVPGVDTVCAEPELPAKNAARLAQLAPFALEEHLATEIDAMHFAVGKRKADGKTPVVALLRERLEVWLNELKAAGIEPDALYAESAVIPGTATLIVDSGTVYVRHSQCPGLALDVQPLDEALRLAIGEYADQDSAIVLRDLQLYAAQSDYELHHDTFAALRERLPGLEIKLLPEGALPLFAIEASRGTAVNLLCGPYRRKSTFMHSFAPWRQAAMLAGVAVLLHVGYEGLRLGQAMRTERQLDRQIRQVVTQVLPGATLRDTRDARKQVETRLNALRADGGRDGLLNGLSILGEALAQAPETRVEALAYRARTLDVRLLAPNVETLDKVQQAATAAGLSAKINAATPRADKIEGRLQFKAGA